MKKFVKRVFALLLVLLLIASAIWYMFVYDRNTVRDFLSEAARVCAAHGNYNGATWFYGLSYEISDKDQNVAIELADIYKSVDNYTKAEYTLSNAIADGGNADLYQALCRTYVEQDKLLDAVQMLDKISDPAIKAELDARRPAAPTADFESGFYNQYITVTFQHEDGTLYASTDGSYPSLEQGPVTGPITLGGGETKIYAVTVTEDGLVSPVAIFNYTIGGVIEELTLTDPAMDAVIRDALMFGQDTEIFSDDLWEIKDFTVPAEAASLEDLKHLTQLHRLVISGHHIDSFEFLSGMTHLEELVISDCTIADSLSSVGALPALKKLTISDCSLSTVAELAGAVGLTELDLSHNIIGDLSPLAGMTALQNLNMDSNALSDLSVLSGLSQLNQVSLAHNAITSIASLSSCSGITVLDVSHNNLTAVTAVDHMPNLSEFRAAENNINTAEKLSSCAALQKLDLSGNALTDLSSLSVLVNLMELNISDNALTSIPDFPGSSSLAILEAEHNNLTDISALSGLGRLNYVYLDYNPELKEFGCLLDCPQLTQVNAFGTRLGTDVADQLIDRNVIVNFDPTAASTEPTEG